jgi:hypothetical protein
MLPSPDVIDRYMMTGALLSAPEDPARRIEQLETAIKTGNTALSCEIAGEVLGLQPINMTDLPQGVIFRDVASYEPATGRHDLLSMAHADDSAMNVGQVKVSDGGEQGFLVQIHGADNYRRLYSVPNRTEEALAQFLSVLSQRGYLPESPDGLSPVERVHLRQVIPQMRQSPEGLPKKNLKKKETITERLGRMTTFETGKADAIVENSSAAAETLLIDKTVMGAASEQSTVFMEANRFGPDGTKRFTPAERAELTADIGYHAVPAQIGEQMWVIRDALTKNAGMVMLRKGLAPKDMKALERRLDLAHDKAFQNPEYVSSRGRRLLNPADVSVAKLVLRATARHGETPLERRRASDILDTLSVDQVPTLQERAHGFANAVKREAARGWAPISRFAAKIKKAVTPKPKYPPLIIRRELLPLAD